MNINGETFREPYILLGLMIGCQDERPEEIQERKRVLFEETKRFRKSYDEFANSDKYIGNPDEVIAVLDDYYEYIGSLKGLAEALSKAVRISIYKDLTEKGRAKDSTAKYTQGDRETYSKAESADLDGVCTSLEALERSIWERLGTLKGRKSRY